MQIFLIILGILGTLGFFTLFGWLIQIAITHKANELSLKNEVSSLKEEKSQAVITLQKVIDKYASENAGLKEKLAKYTNRDIILSKYDFVDRIGIYKLKNSNSYFCHKCLVDKTLESPLKTEAMGWRCGACGSFYDNPDYHHGRQVSSQGYDPFA
ncbi:MAG: hypothetical protein NT014_00090 [Candidatus Omnitrophica bacterium]|nr:hypothetical protein [Candidatus Omnitrophota bacterium]